MTPEEKEIIKDLKKCNFNDFNEYYKQKSEERKNMTKEEKLVSPVIIHYYVISCLSVHFSFFFLFLFFFFFFFVLLLIN